MLKARCLQTTETALGAQLWRLLQAHEFKFINGAGWNGGEENMNGTSCNAGGNRGAEFDAENNTYEACFNICPGESCLPDPDPANLTFQVDASEVDLAGESMYVFGAFTGWQGGAIEMTDNGDGTWQTTQLVSGSVNVDYKYSIGVPTNDGNDESGSYVLAGDSTTFEAQGCGLAMDSVDTTAVCALGHG